MLLLTLLACHAECVPFEEMTVADPDDLDEGGIAAEIEGAIADFALWTGRGGVCVPGVTLVADVPEDDPDHRKVGSYRGRHDPMLVQVSSNLTPRAITLHELCHALDYNEDLEESWPEGAFRAESVAPDLDYDSVETRIHEAFARTCAVGPLDLVIATALDSQCGTLGLDSGAGYIQTEVYPDYTTTSFDSTPFSLTVEARPVAIDSMYAVYGAASYAREVLVLVDWYDRGRDGYRVGVLRLDATSGAALGRIEIRGPRPYASGVRMAVSDARPVALVYRYGGDEEITAAYEIDPKNEIATNLGFAGLPRYVDAAAWLDGVLTIADGGSDGPRLTAWDRRTGGLTDIEGETRVHALQPSPAGLERADMDGVFRLGDDGIWAPLTTRPGYFYGFVPVSTDERLWIGGPDGTPALLNVATGRWRLPANPCDVPPLTGAQVLFTVDEQPFVLGTTADDGTGVPVLYALSVE